MIDSIASSLSSADTSQEDSDTDFNCSDFAYVDDETHWPI